MFNIVTFTIKNQNIHANGINRCNSTNSASCTKVSLFLFIKITASLP